jgi:hypothetical protein
MVMLKVPLIAICQLHAGLTGGSEDNPIRPGPHHLMVCAGYAVDSTSHNISKVVRPTGMACYVLPHGAAIDDIKKLPTATDTDLNFVCGIAKDPKVNIIAALVIS